MSRMLPARPGPVFLCVSSLISAPALAMAEVPGWFVEADVRNVDSSGIISGFTLDDDDNGASIAVGYSFNPNFSLQAGYHDMGSHFATDCPPPLLCLVSTSEQVDVSGWSAAAIASWPFTENFELFGTLGVMGWNADFTYFRNLDDSGTDLLYGAGVAWWPSTHWRLSLGYERVDLDLDSVKLGLRYQF